jgi:hypothetical protein
VRREDDDHKENIGIIMNSMNFGRYILIRKYRVHTRYEILTYRATIARQKTLDDGHIRPKHVVWKKGD